jgi:AcrR family transcriptional regulator
MTAAETPRRRDAVASRERLLRAASALFADRGFDRTTARDIAERAGVDAAMIARYFGGKAQLFVEVLRAEDLSEIPADFFEPERLLWLLDRFDSRGPGPVLQAALHPYDDPAAQSAAREELDRRVLVPLRLRLAQRGDSRSALRAELITAAVIGVLLGRYSGAFGALGNAETAEVLALVQEMLERCSPEPTLADSPTRTVHQSPEDGVPR